MGIIIKNALIKAYHSIGIIKYYYKPLQQVYLIINTKIPGIEPELVVQIFFEAINNLMSFNKLILTILVFGAYSKITKLDALFLLITQYIMAMNKAIDKI